ncbi:MAG: hypothetical protein JNK23_13420 [Opitutaceae bacterium]|nr:hypothetical protein [Opitutaceae bacterium]
MPRHLFSSVTLLCLASLAGFTSAGAEPLSRKTEIDFYRDVPSRNLKGLATRSDGRLVAGPVLRDLAAPPPADILWSLEPSGDPTKFLVGTGPDGRILELTLDAALASFTTREIAKLDDPQVFAVRRLADGALLAGTSPKGALHLIRDGASVARVALPVDSIFDLLLLNDGTALAATGNPGRIYRIDLAKLTAAGLNPEKTTDAAVLAERGVTLFGEIRDRNVRRLVALSDGRIAAGSSPKGNLYAFPAAGGPPVILQENRDAEVTDLLPQPNGDLFATFVFTTTSNEARLTPSTPAGAGTPAAPRDPTPPPATIERFAGRSTVMLYPAKGFPETITTRANTAFYRLARHGDTLLFAGGEQGEVAGYDLKARLPLTYAGSASAQLNGLAPLGDGKFLILRNNVPGLAVLDFAAEGPREAETRRLDFGVPSLLGALRFDRIRHLAESALTAEVRVSNGTDDVEGWTPWTPLAPGTDSGWRAAELRGRHAKLRLKFSGPANLEIDRAALHTLPQNRRPVLQDFRIVAPGYSMIPAREALPSPATSLSQLISPAKDEERRRSLLSSQIMMTPGSQIVVWTLADPDGDTLLSTFSIRRDGETAWIDLVNASKENHAQFDTRNLPDGIYFTRLLIEETAPRPVAERLKHTVETDNLVIDNTAPTLLEATARRSGENIVVSVSGRDALSLLEGIEVVFNSGLREEVTQPADGVRDGREETFTLEVPLARISNATSVEVTIYDAAGNGAARRLQLTP